MGDTGPCGPCSEIFFDHGDAHPGRPARLARRGRRPLPRDLEPRLHAVRADRARQSRSALPRPSIDTGMGLERIAAVLQGTHVNYDTDLFRTLIDAVAHATGVAPEGDRKASHRVIADHLRASSFLVADGVLPSNEGRGYVLRRIMRRAMRHAQLLGARDPLMYRLVPALVREMGQAYPELVRAEPLITETLKLEETRFRKTLERGLGILDEETRTPRLGPEPLGRVGLHALRHLRLPARPDAGRAEGPRHRRRYRRLRRGDGAPAREGPRGLVRLRRGGDRDGLVRRQGARRRDRVPRLRHRDRRRRRHSRCVKDGQEVEALKAGESGPRGPQPDAVLRRIRRPGRRYRRRCRARGLRCA